VRLLLAFGWGALAASPLLWEVGRLGATARGLALRPRIGHASRVRARGLALRPRASSAPCRKARERTVLEDGLPLTADLLAVALGAGLTPYLALGVATRSAAPPVAVHLAAVLADVDQGRRLADALEARSTAAPALRPLLDVLLASERLGAPVGPALARLAADARARARRTALERARTLPVRLLFPLVFLVLPAFLLLTVGPVVLAGLAA
jgi:pilus assembly protein TadC